MNTYMYAPKDDCKHRAFWRDLYSVEEAGNYPYQSQLIFLLHNFLGTKIRTRYPKSVSKFIECV